MAPVTVVVTVAAAGTPVRVSTISIQASHIRVEPARANTGRILVGDSSLSASTLAGVISDLAIPGVADIPSLDIDAGDGTNALDVSDYYIDATVNGEKARVTYWRK